MKDVSVKKPTMSTVIQPMAAAAGSVNLPSMPETIIDRIHQRLATLGIKEAHASRMASPNRSSDTIRNIRRTWNASGKVSATAATLEALARVLETSVHWLLTGEESSAAVANRVTEVPLVSWVAASGFTEVQAVDSNRVERRISVAGLSDGDFIALEVRGDSMNLIAPDGSIVIVNRRATDLIDKKFYIVVINESGETTFKRYREDWPPRLEPFSTNLDHKTINLRDLSRIIGRVVRIITDV